MTRVELKNGRYRNLPHMWQSGEDGSSSGHFVMMSKGNRGNQEAQVVAQSRRERVVAQEFTDVTFFGFYFQSSLAVP